MSSLSSGHAFLAHSAVENETTRFNLSFLGGLPDVYQVRVILDPTLLRTNDDGNSWESSSMALRPVQCIGITTAGANAFSRSTVFPNILS